MADVLTEILRAASRHPNSRVSKLIYTVEEEPTQKNIVLLLIELAEHSEYSTDFNVSLKYYLEIFERLGINSDLVLNEAGLLLVNSSKIYSKRVDYVQSLVERQILTLSNADEELQKQKLEQQQSENAAPTEKPKRGRKRVLEVSSDPYEVELSAKKFKKLTEEKRFAVPKSIQKAKSIQRNIEMEQQIHPAGWLHATIYDLENEEDVDTKRNYKLFTFHIEHRYNTLVPDINFRLHFKVKDYMDEQEEMEDEACNTDRSWPPLSEAYVQKYLSLENYVLQKDLKANKRKAAELDGDDSLNEADSQTEIRNDSRDPANNFQWPLNSSNINDSGLDQTLLDCSAVNTSTNVELQSANKSLKHLDSSNLDGRNDSGFDQTLLDCSAVNTSTNVELQSANKSKENLDSSNLDGKNDSGFDQTLLDFSAVNTSTNVELQSANKSKENLDSSNLDSKNDSGLGQSILNETNDTLETTLLDSTNSENPNTNSAETNKSLNSTENQPGNDSALGTSVLQQTNNDSITEATGNPDTTNSENLNDRNVDAEANKSLNGMETQLENNTITEGNDLKTNRVANNATTEANESLDIIKEGDDNKTANPTELCNATEYRKDSALGDERHHSISTENLAVSMENLNKIDKLTANTFEIDVGQQEPKDKNQIHIQLPDDEGVYLSDLEDHDFRLLSPLINVTNILPGVERKDVTIYMDDELREALEMRDGIMKHFSHETFKVPVIKEPTKQNLLFNILKLPEKMVRRKILFKLGPEMDLYLQARSFKRCRPETPARVIHTPKLLQWFSLNNTDMSGVCMTPPYSPGHTSDFCGFSDNEDNGDNISSSEFCGFTVEERETLILNHLSRLSRDSGVGVDGNNLTPDKETLEIIFEENSKRNLNLDETPNTSDQSTESLLNQLSDAIQDVLRTELDGNNETQDDENNKPNTEASCSEATRETENFQTQSSMENSECITTENSLTNNTLESDMALTEKSNETQTCSGGSTQSMAEPLTSTQASNLELTENSKDAIRDVLTTELEGNNETPDDENNKPNTEASCSDATRETENLKTQSCMENSECITTENSSTNNTLESDIVLTEKSNETQTCSGGSTQSTAEHNAMHCNITDESNKSADELLKEKLDFVNSMAESASENHGDVIENDVDYDEMLSLDTLGIKTKIQQWHEHLQPILSKSRERHHFDVFKLGSEIIETVQRKYNSNDESANELKSSSDASFQDIMESKDNSYVSRYFLSTLLLANQSNIEISIENKSSEKPSSWHDIHLKLLSTKRHTVAIEDNIGMIDNKQKASDNKSKQNTKEKLNRVTAIEEIQEDEEEDDEPLIKLQSSKKLPKKSKTSLKRNSDNTITSLVAEKKPKETTTNIRPKELPYLIQNVQILTSPVINTPVAVRDMNMMPSTSRQAQNFNTTALFNDNIHIVRTLQPIKKVQKISDDYDSGIFSIEEMSTS